MFTRSDGIRKLFLVRADGRTVWLSQREVAELFTVSQDAVGLHLKNIFADEVLRGEATTEDSSVVQMEGEGGPTATHTRSDRGRSTRRAGAPDTRTTDSAPTEDEIVTTANGQNNTQVV